MELNKYLLHVNGITCASCVQKLENISKSRAEIKTAHVYFGQSLLEVETYKEIDPAGLIQEIKNLGFKAEILENKAQIFEANKKVNREHLNRVGVAGFCAGNIMLATIPLYTGVESEFRPAFSYLSFILFLPVVFYSALDFYNNAWRSLKTKNLNIDLPIAVALLAGFIFSTYNLLRSEYDYLYYDSTASFIFLILSARYLLSRLQQNFVATYSDSDFGLNQAYQLIGQDKQKKKEELGIGDRILLMRNQTLPCKAKLLSEQSEWSLALITGESYPKDYHKEMVIESGAILLSQSSEVEVLERYQDSLICHFQNKLESLKKSKSEFVSFTDKFSHYFIFTVFSIAAIFTIYYWRIDSFEAFQRALALLIVACPCALALGTPLAYLLGAYRAKQQGILIFKKDIFDRMLDIKNIFFDKTGTLTQGQISVQQVIPFDPELINIILNLEKVSQHPIAFAIRKKFQSHYYDLGIESQEISGVGVEGEWKNDLYRFIKNVEADRMSSALYKNDEPVLVIYFEDQLRPDTRNVIEKLKKSKKELSLLTGDKKVVAREVADICGISSVYSNQTPEKKKDIILNNAPALMVGDGLNDALALQAAHVGISVCGSVQMSADHSDAYLLKSGISQISSLFHLSEKVRSTIYTNLGISLFYNITAGYFALTGYINPLVAAILMPISSIVILLNTLRGVR